MTASLWRDPSRAPAGRVTIVEVFFDVVFVFTLTQLTQILEADLSLAGIAEARRSLHAAPLWSRLVTAAVVLATAPIGTVANAGLQLAAVVAVVVAMLLLDARRPAAATLHEPAT